MNAGPFWKTWVALALLLGVGAYVYFVEMKREDKPESTKEKVLVFDQKKVREVKLSGSAAEPVHLVASQDGWRMAVPTPVAADKAEVEALLSGLGGAEIEEVVVEKPGSLVDFGLAPPRGSITLVVEGQAQPLQLLLGERTPDGTGLYAQRPGQPRVFTMPSYLEGSVLKKPFELRDRDVLHLKRDAVRTVHITGPEGDYSLSRDENSEWAFTHPLATRAGRWSVDGLLGALETLHMDSVAAEEAKDLKAFGLDKPARTVTLDLVDGTRKRLEIGKTAGDKLYNAREASAGPVVVISGAIVDDLAKGMSELRAKRLLDVTTYVVQGIETDADGVHRTYARSSVKDAKGADVFKWKRTAPDAKDLETNKVQDALFLVGGLEVQEFLDKAPPGPVAAYGLDKPALKVTLRLEDTGRAPVWFEIGQKDGAFYGRRAGDNAVLKLDPAKAGDLLKAFKEL